MMVDKFPGTDRKGVGISTSIEDLGMWDEREAIAERLYDESTANDPVIHCNRFPSWGELNEESRKPWRAKAYRQMIDPDGVEGTPHGGCPNMVGNPREGYSCRIGCGERCEHPAGGRAGDKS
jgi:hypothetical protein